MENLITNIGSNEKTEKHYIIYIRDNNNETLLSIQIKPKHEIIFKGKVITEEEFIEILKNINTV